MLAPDPHPDSPATPGHHDTAATSAPAPPAHLLTCSPAQASPLTSRDTELLRLLRDPSGIGAIDPAEYAAWIERPEIQKAIAAQDDLHGRRQRLQAEADNRLSRERLRAVLEATMDLTNESQRTDHRRAATALGRLSRPAPARSPYHRITVSPSHTSTAHRSPFPAPSALSAASAVNPPLPSGPLQSAISPPSAPSPLSPSAPSSAFPGLDTTIAAFLAAAGTPEGLPNAAELVANHRIIEIGAHNLMQWLEDQTAPLRGAALRPGRTINHDHYDAAEHYIHAVHPDGALSRWIIGCVLERDPHLNPTRWAIARVDPDTS